MNIRTASLLTALLFLAAPLALVPMAQAQAEPATDCLSMTPGPACVLNDADTSILTDCIPIAPGPNCPVGPVAIPASALTCVEPAGLANDPLWTNLCKVAQALGAESVPNSDADHDGRDDIAFDESNSGLFIQLDYFFTDGSAVTKDELYAPLNPTSPYKVRVDPFLYNPADGSRMDDAYTIGDIPYYLTNQHTYLAPDQPGGDANSDPDQLPYTLGLVVEIPDEEEGDPLILADDGQGAADGGVYGGFVADHAEGISMGTTQCVACIDPAHARLAFGAFYVQTTDPTGPDGFDCFDTCFDGSDESVIDLDVPGVEDSILEKSDITTVLYIKVNDVYGIDTGPTTYPDTTNLAVSAIHIKDVSDKDWTVNFQFRSDLDDDGWPDYLELDCGTNPTGASNCDDFDGDQLSNAEEAADFYPEIVGTQSTNPYDVDSDNDGQWDAVDDDPLALRDFDSDGVLNGDDNCPTIPNANQRDFWGAHNIVAGDVNFGDRCADSDLDGILDYIEDDNSPFGVINASPAPGNCDAWGDSNPESNDTDGDGYLDAEEDTSKDGAAHKASSSNGNDCNWTRTDPNRADTDGDGVTDKVEKTGSYVWNGYGPHPGALNPLLKNDDGDGLDAAAELAGTYNSYCKVASGPSIRVDASATDSCTAPNPTNPKSADSDGDRSSDAQEKSTGSVAAWGVGVPPVVPNFQTDPVAGAFDTFDTDPTRADTDNDSYGDRYEERPFNQAVPRIPVIGMDVPEPTTTKSDPTNPASKPVPVLPVIDPNQPRPDPVAVLTNPDCYLQQDNTFTEECYTSEGVLGDLDSRDGGDTDGDGETDDSDNQVDFVEERILRINPDDGDASPEGLEGTGTTGATFTTYELRIGGQPVEEYTTRLGDVGRSSAASEIVVFLEHRDGAPKYISCIYSTDGDLRMAGFDVVGYTFETEGHQIGFLDDDADPHFGNEAQFSPNADEPCGPSQSLGAAPVDPGTLGPTLCDSGVEAMCPPAEPVDSDGDGVEDSKDRCPGLDDNDAEACPPAPPEPSDPCDPMGDSFPEGCDPTAPVCGEDPIGLPVCAEGGPLGDSPVACGPDPDSQKVGPLLVCTTEEGGPLTKFLGLPGIHILVFKQPVDL